METSVTKRGQTVVPAAIRRRYHIDGGSRLVWLDDGETIRVVPVPPTPLRRCAVADAGVASPRSSWMSAGRTVASTKRPEPPLLLDTSAVLTLIEDEAGADRVEEALRLETTLVPWPVLLEAHYVILRDQGQAEADRCIALIKQLGVIIIWGMDEATMLTAARIKAQHRVSLADALIAAFAVRAGAVLVHKDPEFESLAGLLTMERLPYKA